MQMSRLRLVGLESLIRYLTGTQNVRRMNSFNGTTTVSHSRGETVDVSRDG